jgi:hypothetical protein
VAVYARTVQSDQRMGDEFRRQIVVQRRQWGPRRKSLQQKPAQLGVKSYESYRPASVPSAQCGCLEVWLHLRWRELQHQAPPGGIDAAEDARGISVTETLSNGHAPTLHARIEPRRNRGEPSGIDPRRRLASAHLNRLDYVWRLGQRNIPHN